MNEPKREFILNEDVEPSTVKEIIMGIREVNQYDDKQIANTVGYVRKPIILIVNTYGGTVYDGFALVATIDISKTPVHTICLGKAMSMGLIIFASGHWRIAHPLATLMYHQLSKGSRGFLKDMEESLEEGQRLNALYDDYILRVSNIRQSKLDEVKSKKTNWYISATEAKKYGLVDEIINKD